MGFVGVGQFSCFGFDGFLILPFACEYFDVLLQSILDLLRFGAVSLFIAYSVLPLELQDVVSWRSLTS